MYRHESCTIKKAESWRIDAFELWCWRRFLRIPWTTRRSNKSILNIQNIQSWIFIGRTDAEAPILWPPDVKSLLNWKRLWCWEKLKARGEGDYRWQDCWMASPNQWIWVWANSGRWWRTEKPGVLQSMRSQRVGHYLTIEQQCVQLDGFYYTQNLALTTRI